MWCCQGTNGVISNIEEGNSVMFITLSDHDKLTLIKAGPQALHFGHNVSSMTVNATADGLVKKLFNQLSKRGKSTSIHFSGLT